MHELTRPTVQRTYTACCTISFLYSLRIIRIAIGRCVRSTWALQGRDQEDDKDVQGDGRRGEEDYHGNNLHSQVRIANAGLGEEHAPPPEPGTSAATPNIMPQAYFQCRAARDASFQDKAVEISARSTLGIIEGGRWRG